MNPTPADLPAGAADPTPDLPSATGSDAPTDRAGGDDAAAGTGGHLGATGAPWGTGPRVSRADARDLGRLRRSVTDRKVAGVAGGLARHLDIDPVILRVAFVVLAFFGGAGLVLYGALWALVPEEGRTSAAVSLDERGRTAALVAAGALAAFAVLGDSLGGSWWPGMWPLGVIALVVMVLVMRRQDRSVASGPRSAAPATGWPGPVDPETRATWAEGAPADASTGRDADAATYGDPYYAGYPGYPGYPDDRYPAAPPRPGNPRRRGPVLFWFTLALVALALGVLGMADVAGAPVTDSAYPALALTVVGGMLLVGAFYGRAGGLILLGLVGTLAVVGSSVGDQWDGDVRSVAPATATDVTDDYSMGAGELVLDLSRVADPDALAGRDLLVEGGLGRLEVIVPTEMDVQVDGEVGVGSLTVFDRTEDGPGVDLTGSRDGSGDADLSLKVRLGMGEVVVSHR